jgi:hypothetical protein
VAHHADADRFAQPRLRRHACRHPQLLEVHARA